MTSLEHNEQEGMAAEDLCSDYNLGEYVTMAEDGKRCKCITCKPGYIPHRRDINDRDSSYCKPCPPESFTDHPSILGRTTRCTNWSKCDQDHMFVSSKGGPTHDTECSCTEGYVISKTSQTCVGRTSTSGTQVPTSIPDIQAPSSILDIEVPTNIKDTPATKNVSDTEPTRNIPDSTTGDQLQNNGAELAVASNTATNKKFIAAILGQSLIIVALIAVAIVLYKRRKRRKPRGHDNNANIIERTHISENSIQNISDQDLQRRVLSICLPEVGLKIGRDWKKLGQHLLNDNLDYALEGISDSSIEVKTFQILTNWQQNLGHSATTKVLLDTLRSMRRQDIIDHLCQVVYNDPELGLHFQRDNPHEEV